MKKKGVIYRKQWVYGFLITAGLLAAWLLRSSLSDLLAWVGDREAVITSIQELGFWGPIVLFCLLVLQVFLALIPGHALMLAGSYVFGFTTSLLITVSSTVLGSQIAFLIARRFGRKVIHRLADADHIAKWENASALHGGLFYFFSFVLPIFPSDLMCYVAGLSTLSSRRFLLANFSGRLVCAAFLTLVGSNGLKMPVTFWAAAALGLGTLYGAWRFYISGRRCQRQWAGTAGD